MSSESFHNPRNWRVYHKNETRLIIAHQTINLLKKTSMLKQWEWCKSTSKPNQILASWLQNRHFFQSWKVLIFFLFLNKNISLLLLSAHNISFHGEKEIKMWIFPLIPSYVHSDYAVNSQSLLGKEQSNHVFRLFCLKHLHNLVLPIQILSLKGSWVNSRGNFMLNYSNQTEELRVFS